jgi:hypothetical protein
MNSINSQITCFWLTLATPALPLNRNLTDDQFRFNATLTDHPGETAMQMSNISGQGWKEAAANFAWRLHSGTTASRCAYAKRPVSKVR